MMHSAIFVLSLLGLLSNFASALEVKTSIGVINSKYESFGEKGGVHKFMGIPYAEPPVGENRFKPPISKKALDGVLNAHKAGPVCPQHAEQHKFFNFTDDPDSNFDMSEDCLFMNIYVPSEAENGISNNKLPVMFYVHSGGWSWGSGNHYDGRWLPLYGKVILVTFNFRLGVLGFLRTDDRKVINNGLKDQILAFKWMRQNIESFGGDPDMITVFGHSAGGVSTVYLAAVPELKGKIRRIIPLAGVPSAKWADFSAVVRQNQTTHVAAASGCDPNDLLNCLKTKNIEELALISLVTTASMKVLTAWMPTPDSRLIALDSNTYASEFVIDGLEEVDILGNMATSEGTSVLFYMVALMGLDMNRDHISMDEMRYFTFAETQEEADAFLQKTLPEKVKSEKALPVSLAMDFLTEYATWYPLYDLLRTHEELVGPEKQTYMLLYGYVPEERRGLFPRPPWQKKSIHGDELPLVFGSLLSEVNPSTSETDIKMAKHVIAYLTNFVKSGDPNKPSPVPEHWPPFAADHPHHLSNDQSGRFADAHLEFMVHSPEFWDKYYGVLGQDYDEGDDVLTDTHDDHDAHDEL